MKLAEALLLRSDMQKKLASLRERIAKNVLVQEGSPPYEDANALLLEAFGVNRELHELIVSINGANLRHALADGRSLTAAIGERDTLAQQHAILQQAIAATHKEADRYSPREIKWKSTIDVGSLQKQSDDLARKIRELNVQIQAVNWSVDL